MATANHSVGGKRQRTRSALVEAAFVVVAERGLEAASLDAIAAQAGLTKGAIYSNFRGRADLLAAVVEARTPMLQPQLFPGAPLRRQLQAFAEAVIGLLQDPARARFMTEYHRHGRSDAAMSAALAARYATLFKAMGPYFESGPGELTVPGPVLMMIVQSLMLGLVHQALTTPDAVTPGAIRAAFDALADGVGSGR